MFSGCSQNCHIRCNVCGGEKHGENLQEMDHALGRLEDWMLGKQVLAPPALACIL
jgi:hypothetical protein